MNKQFKIFAGVFILTLAVGLGAFVAPSHAAAINVPVTLDGDITTSVNDGTANSTEVQEVAPGDEVTYTAGLNVKPIKEQMAAIEAQYQNQGQGGLDLNAIELENTQSEFKAEFDLVDGLSFTEEPSETNVTLEDAADTFAVSSVENAAKKTTVIMKLKEGITKYTDLKEAVNKCGDWLKLKLPKVKVAENAAPATQYTVKGTLTGNMSATAKFNGHVVPFNFNWNVQQWQNGKDAAFPNAPATDITATVKTPDIMMNNLTLDGDILIGDETEHTAVYEVKAGQEVAYTGALYIDSIQQKMVGIERLFQANQGMFPDILLENTKSIFTTTFKLPAGMSFAPGTGMGTNVVLQGADALFEITDATVVGDTLTVTMGLKNAINNYKDLKDGVDACVANGPLKVIVDKVKSGKKAGQYTVVGTLEGMMSAKAKLGNNVKSFLFNWKGVQSDAGRDFIAPANSDVIQFTSKVKKSSGGGSSSTERYIIDASAENGTINPEGSVPVLEGTNQDFTYQATEGYTLSKVLVDGKEMDIKTYLKNYLFENVRANHKIHVVFTKDGEPQPPVDPDGGKDKPDGGKDKPDPNTPDGGKDKPGANTPDKNNTVNPTPGTKVTPLAVTPSTPGKTTVEAQTVQTGDNTPFGALIVLMGLAFGAMVLVRRRCR